MKIINKYPNEMSFWKPFDKEISIDYENKAQTQMNFRWNIHSFTALCFYYPFIY